MPKRQRRDPLAGPRKAQEALRAAADPQVGRAVLAGQDRLAAQLTHAQQTAETMPDRRGKRGPAPMPEAERSKQIAVFARPAMVRAMNAEMAKRNTEAFNRGDVAAILRPRELGRLATLLVAERLADLGYQLGD